METKITVTLNCFLCDNEKEIEIDVQEWKQDSIEEENALCPDHAVIMDFADSQCSGCVGGWGECSLFKDITDKETTLIDADHRKIETGICPRRTNGTFTFDSRNGKMEHVNLSDVATIESGAAFAKAIKEYRAKYCEDTPCES